MSNTYKIVIPPGCGYPMFVPVDPSKLKRRWLPYGKRVEPITLCGGASESYFKQRYGTQRTTTREADDQSTSYPRIVNQVIPENNR